MDHSQFRNSYQGMLNYFSTTDPLWAMHLAWLYIEQIGDELDPIILSKIISSSQRRGRKVPDNIRPLSYEAFRQSVYSLADHYTTGPKPDRILAGKFSHMLKKMGDERATQLQAKLKKSPVPPPSQQKKTQKT